MVSFKYRIPCSSNIFSLYGYVFDSLKGDENRAISNLPLFIEDSPDLQLDSLFQFVLIWWILSDGTRN
jgi:hypothetical protein